MAICGNCFHKLRDSGSCPYCGYDHDRDPRNAKEALPVGTALHSRYVLGRVLERNGYWIKYLAADTKTGGIGAVVEYYPAASRSVFRPEGSSRVQLLPDGDGESVRSGRRKFLSKARTISQNVRSEQLTRIYNCFEENDTAYLTMEYVRGESLCDYLKRIRRPLSADEAARLLLPFMEALARLHEKGILHGGISPETIIIRPDGKAKLVLDLSQHFRGIMDSGTEVLTPPPFLAPEQYAAHRKQGPFTDVYALAATWYYAVTGKTPPRAVSRLQADPLVIPGRPGIDVNGKEKAVLAKALDPRPENRYQTMTEFRDALTATCADARKHPVLDIFR